MKCTCKRRTGALKRYLCGIRWSTKNCRYIWVKESIQRRRMIIATTQSIRQRKHQSYSAYHRVRQLSSIPRESLNLCRCLWRCCPRTSRNKTRIKGFTRVLTISNYPLRFVVISRSKNHSRFLFPFIDNSYQRTRTRLNYYKKHIFFLPESLTFPTIIRKKIQTFQTLQIFIRESSIPGK